MTNTDDILSFWRKKKELLFSECQLIKIGLFDSLAIGEGTQDSEIDHIVEFQPNTENLTENKSKIRMLIANRFGIDVDFSKKNIYEALIQISNITNCYLCLTKIGAIFQPCLVVVQKSKSLQVISGIRTPYLQLKNASMPF